MVSPGTPGCHRVISPRESVHVLHAGIIPVFARQAVRVVVGIVDRLSGLAADLGDPAGCVVAVAEVHQRGAVGQDAVLAGEPVGGVVAVVRRASVAQERLCPPRGGIVGVVSLKPSDLTAVRAGPVGCVPYPRANWPLVTEVIRLSASY